MEKQVSEIERSVGVRFPGALRRLLLEHDARAVRSMFGGPFSAQRLVQLRERLGAGWARSYPSPKVLGDFVVFASEGDELLFLIASEGDDPPVYEWFEGNDRARRRWPSFSACARDLLTARAPFVGCL